MEYLKIKQANVLEQNKANEEKGMRPRKKHKKEIQTLGPMCSHTKESNKSTKLEVIIYPQSTCRIKGEKKNSHVKIIKTQKLNKMKGMA